MPITVRCDECSESHRVKDEAVGKRFKCRGCGKFLKVEAPAPPEDDFSNFDDAELNDEDAEESEEAADDSRKKAPRRAKSASAGRKGSTKAGKPKSVPIGRTKVPLGIDCVFFGFLATILVVLIVFAVTWSSRGNPVKVVPVLFWMSLVGFAATVVTTVGKLLCLTAPPQMPGKGTIYVAVAIDVLALSITMASFVATVPALLTSAINLLSIAGFVSFILFLQNLGDFLGERDLRERGSGVLMLGIGIVVLLAVQVGLALAAQARALPPIVAGLGVLLVMLVLLVVGVFFVIRYAGLLSTCRYALSNC